MASKPSSGKTTANLEAIHAAIDRRDFSSALAMLREKSPKAPGNESIGKFYHETLLKAAQHYAESRRLAEFSTVMPVLEQYPMSAEYASQLALLYASAGKYAEAYKLATAHPEGGLAEQILQQVVDTAVREQNASLLPEELRETYRNFQKAFSCYELGNDEGARELLGTIGMASPFLDWKMMLRGIMAYTQNENDRALENWQRLNEKRLPFRLIIGLRSTIDTAFRDTLPKDELPRLEKRNESLGISSPKANLEKLRGLLAGDDSVSKALVLVEKIAPNLKQNHPLLIPRLADVIYDAILKHGQPQDMQKHLKIFGPMADDPKFYRLQAIVLCGMSSYDKGIESWENYERWLASSSCKWPAELCAAARSTVQLKIAAAIVDYNKEGEDDEASSGDIFAAFFRYASRLENKKIAKKMSSKDPETYFRKAIELAPQSEDALAAYVMYCTEHKSAEEVLEGLTTWVERFPNSIMPRAQLALELVTAGRAGEALPHLLHAQSLNPLDKILRNRLASICLAAARQSCMIGKFDEADALLTQHQAICESEALHALVTLRSAMARKQGNKEEAEALEQAALKIPSLKPAVLLHLLVNIILLKCKPADKNAVNKTFTETLETPMHPAEAIQLLSTWANFAQEGFTYVGQKTHGTKILAAVQTSLNHPQVSMDVIEFVMISLTDMKQLKDAAKVCDHLLKRDPYNPMAYYYKAKIQLELKPNSRTKYQLAGHLHNALSLAKQSKEAKYRDLIPDIEMALDEITPMGFPFF